MRRIFQPTQLFIIAAFITACGGVTENKPPVNKTLAANVNSVLTPSTSAPVKDDLTANEKRAWTAWKSKDGKYFEDYLVDNAFGMSGKGRVDKAAIVKRIGDPTCEVKDFSLSEEQMRPLGSDAALLTYKATQDVKCGGKALPAVVRAATVLIRSGDKWKAVYHNEVPIVDPKATAQLGEPEETLSYEKAKLNVSDGSTTAMFEAEKKVWEAWKDHDGKKLDELTTKDISFINIFGTFFPTKADALKDWTAKGCEVTSVSVTDAASTMLSPAVGILTFKGGADGKCFGQKVPPIWGTSIYIKDGDTWKWTFGMNLSAD